MLKFWKREGEKRMRIGICDDSADARDALRLLLEKRLKEGEEIVYEFSTGAGAASWFQKHPGEIELLFLDVEMKGINGMEAARRIREFDNSLMIVFVTGYADYVFEGYRVGALDYLIKPVEENALKDVLVRVRRQLLQKRPQMYLLKNTDGFFRFPIHEISYFYSDRRKVTLVLQEKEYSFYGKLDEVERELPGFVRIHQRFLVNPDKAEHMGAGSVVINGHELPMSRALREAAAVKLAKAML